MLNEIKDAYNNGRLMLFLGAGASAQSVDFNGKEIPMGSSLAEELSSLMKWDYNRESLSTVYSAINSKDPALLHNFLRTRLTNTTPSHHLKTIASFPWQRVFTLNIDDCFEVAVRQSSKQRLQIFSRNDPLEDLDPVFNTLQLIKLNGSADKPSEGFIFSPQEYGGGATRLPTWYRELGQNYGNYTFLFIGTRLNEPLFQHTVSEMRSTTNRSTQAGYIITRSATQIEQEHLASLNLRHISASLEDFSKWLHTELTPPPSTWDLATAKRPELRTIKKSLSDHQKRTLNCITIIETDTLPYTTANNKIRDFYRGYKPKWSDIIDEVPANLEFIRDFTDIIQKYSTSNKCISLIGQAGSGKTTAMMMSALNISRLSKRPVYFLREPVLDIKEIILSLEEINEGLFYLFIDKIDGLHNSLANTLQLKEVKNICVVYSERINIWNQRIKAILEDVTEKTYTITKITETDAKDILKKVKQFGPWTRLQKLTPENRIKEIFKKSDRQLLIGLMEATTGRGFTEIIRDDFAKIGDSSHRKMLTLVGLACIHRSTISTNIVGRALGNLGVQENPYTIALQAEGILLQQDDKYTARHPVYIRELFEKIMNPDDIQECIIAMLQAFSDYETPVTRHVSKPDGVVFKSISNHRFLKDMMRNNPEKVIGVYEKFETVFHIDGLYWLQYGLALRSFGRHYDALDKLRTAKDAFQSPHIEHAYAQQLMIIARESGTWDEAEPLLQESISMFEKLDFMDKQGDTYPLVSQAEGHIKVILRFKGLEEAKKCATPYGNKLLQASKRVQNERLKSAAQSVLTFINSGIWTEDANEELSSEY